MKVLKREQKLLNIILFIVTFFTTTLAGALQEGANIFERPGEIIQGLPFSVTLICILAAHEAGHFIFARRGGVEATYPYFIPAPTMLGTFGAFIKIKTPIPDRNVLMRFSAAGPIAGFLIALPSVVIGLMLSEVKPVSGIEGISLGSSILFEFLSTLIIGLPSDTYDIILHPVAFAGWIGFLITAFNLLPIGQLDGGHILYSVSAKLHTRLSRLAFFLLLPLGFYWTGWFVWFFLIALIGIKHPPIVDEYSQISQEEGYLGIVSFVIFILTFTPMPFNL